MYYTMSSFLLCCTLCTSWHRCVRFVFIQGCLVCGLCIISSVVVCPGCLHGICVVVYCGDICVCVCEFSVMATVVDVVVVVHYLEIRSFC